MNTTTGATITRRPLPCPTCRKPMRTHYLAAGDLVIPLRLVCATTTCQHRDSR